MRALPLLDHVTGAPVMRGTNASNGLARSLPAAPRTVRLSLTDRCDLACVYCRPHRQDGYFEERLSIGAWRTMLVGLQQEGIRRVRITGGEPLLSADVLPFVSLLAELGFEDIALTTNATQLERLARPLKDAGLQRINVSLDTLDPARFERITRGGDLAPVLRGIDSALAVGFSEVKLNTVVVRGENEDELIPITEWSWARGITPRFLEIMAIGEGAALQDRVVSYGEIALALAPLLEESEPRRDEARGPARYVRARRDAKLRVGFITGTTDTYCAGCDRLRVAADGMLRPCLATNDGVSGATVAASGDIDGVRRVLTEAWAKKPDGETWKGCTEDTAKDVSIRQIGG